MYVLLLLLIQYLVFCLSFHPPFFWRMPSVLPPRYVPSRKLSDFSWQNCMREKSRDTPFLSTYTNLFSIYIHRSVFCLHTPLKFNMALLLFQHLAGMLLIKLSNRSRGIDFQASSIFRVSFQNLCTSHYSVRPPQTPPPCVAQSWEPTLLTLSSRCGSVGPLPPQGSGRRHRVP